MKFTGWMRGALGQSESAGMDFRRLATLGIVFLAVTGGEALYADIGHFGKAPIRLSWYLFVLPSLLLNYFGQGALILSRTERIANPFYQMVPAWALYPLVALACCATVIASQAVIAGVFSLSSQGYRLNYLPRLRILHTSSERRGRIYMPMVNWVLFAATVGLVFGFRSSANLGGAYGVAITTTMVITTLLFYVAMREVFHWRASTAIPLAFGLLIVDLAFFIANLSKIPAGGWFPLLIAGTVYLIMETWRKGYANVRRKGRNRLISVRQFLVDIGGGGKYRRVPGQAVYLTSNQTGTPDSLIHNLNHNRALHSTIVIYSAVFVKAPHVREKDHLKVLRLRRDIFRVIAYYGFMDETDVPRDLEAANNIGNLGLQLDAVTFFLGGDFPLAKESSGLSRWRSWIYALLIRNQETATRDFNLPRGQVFVIGKRIQV